jgi:DNA modification methylase
MKWSEDFIHKVIGGNCLEVLNEIPDKSINLVLTDPPNFLQVKHYQTRQRKT